MCIYVYIYTNTLEYIYIYTHIDTILGAVGRTGFKIGHDLRTQAAVTKTGYGT